jgi:hypothetical protein
MTAAATAARTSQSLIGEPAGGAQMALSVAVGGGLVEGVAFGGLPVAEMAPLAPKLNRGRRVLVTLAGAGVGWAAAGAWRQDDGAAPALLLVLGAALGLGAMMGAPLGAAQGSVLPAHARRPWR